MKINMQYFALDPRFEPDHLGYIPSFLSADDPRPAKEQFNENYAHGGGWRPLPGCKLSQQNMVIRYPGDPPLKPFAMTVLREEKLYFYPHSQVLILQPDGSFEVSRMD